MLKEDINGFEDGQAVDEGDIAAVIGYTDGAAIFEDDKRDVFYLPMEEPQMLEIGTVERKDSLVSIDRADPPLRDRILTAVREGRM